MVLNLQLIFLDYLKRIICKIREFSACHLLYYKRILLFVELIKYRFILYFTIIKDCYLIEY